PRKLYGSTTPARRSTSRTRLLRPDGRRANGMASSGAPWRSWDLNRLVFHPDLLDLAERFLGSADLRLYEAELRPPGRRLRRSGDLGDRSSVPRSGRPVLGRADLPRHPSALPAGRPDALPLTSGDNQCASQR